MLGQKGNEGIHIIRLKRGAYNYTLMDHVLQRTKQKPGQDVKFLLGLYNQN